MRDRPLYCISTAAEMMDVHPETLRVWERHGLVSPARRRGQRCYTDADIQRLLFIRHLIDRWGLNLSGVQAYIRLYPCWENDRCPSLRRAGNQLSHAKPCWRRPQDSCTASFMEADLCLSCGRRSMGIRRPNEGSCAAVAGNQSNHSASENAPLSHEVGPTEEPSIKSGLATAFPACGGRL